MGDLIPDHSQSVPAPAAPLAPARRPWRAAGGTAVAAGVMLAKFKGLLYLLLSYKWALIGVKLLVSSFSFLASIWFYALFWGWRFAVGFTVLILVHELGHALFMRFFGVPASLPYFVPGFGAFVQMKGPPAQPVADAYIALAGPLVGGIGAFFCFAMGQASGDRFWYALASTGFFLNLFNLAPVGTLDGGRVAALLSPRIVTLGTVAFLAFLAFRGWWTALVVVAILAIPQAMAAWHGDLDARYRSVDLEQRLAIGAAYFGLAWLLADFMGRAGAAAAFPHAT